MNEQQLRKDSSRAIEARRIMEQPLVTEALNLIRDNLHAIWETSKHEEHDAREDAWRMLKILNEFERYFVKVMEDGKIADKELSLLEKAKEKVKQYF